MAPIVNAIVNGHCDHNSVFNFHTHIHDTALSAPFPRQQPRTPPSRHQLGIQALVFASVLRLRTQRISLHNSLALHLSHGVDLLNHRQRLSHHHLLALLAWLIVAASLRQRPPTVGFPCHFHRSSLLAHYAAVEAGAAQAVTVLESARLRLLEYLLDLAATRHPPL